MVIAFCGGILRFPRIAVYFLLAGRLLALVMVFTASILVCKLAFGEGIISIDCILMSWGSGIKEFRSEFSISLRSKRGPPSVLASCSDLLEFGWSFALDPNYSSGRSTRGCMSGLLLLFLYFYSIPSRREDFFVTRLPTVETGCRLSTFLLPLDLEGDDFVFFSGFSLVSSKESWDTSFWSVYWLLESDFSSD